MIKSSLYPWSKPKYTHDCNGCKFIAAVSVGDQIADGYVCNGGAGLFTAVLRFSDDGPDYHSASRTKDEPINEFFGGRMDAKYVMFNRLVEDYLRMKD